MSPPSFLDNEVTNWKTFHFLKEKLGIWNMRWHHDVAAHKIVWRVQIHEGDDWEELRTSTMYNDAVPVLTAFVRLKK